MPENSVRKPPTDFTIDCILSKVDNQNGEHQKSPTTNHPMNRVLDNPWISKCPLALTFKPSSHRKLSFPPSAPNLSPNLCFNLYHPPSYSENFIKVTQHFTSVHNHFYPATSTLSDASSSADNNNKLLPKLHVYDRKSCDKEIRNSLSLSETCEVKNEIPTSPAPPIYKCSICSKTFDNCDMLDVSFDHLQAIERKLKKKEKISSRYMRNVI